MSEKISLDSSAPYYLIFSKQDGSITRKISIPFDEVKSRSQEMGKTGRTGPLQYQPPCIK